MSRGDLMAYWGLAFAAAAVVVLLRARREPVVIAAGVLQLITGLGLVWIAVAAAGGEGEPDPVIWSDYLVFCCVAFAPLVLLGARRKSLRLTLAGYALVPVFFVLWLL